MHRGLVPALLAAGLTAVVSPAARAAFPDGPITWVNPYGPGGGFDRYSRIIAPAMEKYLPHKVDVVLKTMEGSGGRLGMNFLIRAKPDGYTIGIVNMPGTAIPEIAGEKHAIQVQKMTFLGRLNVDSYAIFVTPKSGIKSVAALKSMKRPAKFPDVGKPGSQWFATVIATEALGIKHVLIPGYKRSTEVALAAIRGDGDAVLGNLHSFDRFVKSGDLKSIGVFADASPWPGVPTSAQLGDPNLSHLVLERLVAGPPGIPADVAKVLGEAIGKAMHDPEVVAWAKKTHNTLDYESPERSRAMVNDALAFFSRFKDELGK